MNDKLADEPAKSARPDFAHPVEAQFAEILDYYGIQWEYEPRTFPLAWDEEGRVTLAFAPDFYLPGQNRYVELTTLRPRLTRQKNRKMRLMKKLYPDIKVKLLKRRDLRDMFTKYGHDQEAARLAGTDAQKRP